MRRAPGSGSRAASRFTATPIADRFMQPSVNVIGRIRGTDPKLRDEYVLFSAHIRITTVRFPTKGDSIWNGADANASTSVALLAIARAWKQHPGRAAPHSSCGTARKSVACSVEVPRERPGVDHRRSSPW